MILRDVIISSKICYKQSCLNIFIDVMSSQCTCLVTRLPRDSAVILSPSVLSPAMAITSDTLHAIVFYTQQELVVNRVRIDT